MLAAAIAFGAFLLPQEAPLVYYPLNQPSDGLMLLEITCAANVRSSTQFFLDTGQGFNPSETISWPMAPSQEPYTYTFPLPDAPLLGLRLDPFFTGPGEFIITNLRIVERHGKEVRRFTKDDFAPLHQIEAVMPTADGWKLVAAAGADDPYAFLEFPAPIVPAGMNGRNLQRCLLSWSYLALMLWILLLAVYFVLVRQRDPRAMVRAAGLLALVSLLFSAVGNRGLIKEAVRCARWPAPSIEPDLDLHVDLTVKSPSPAQLFWDIGRGFNQEDSCWRDYEPHPGLQTLRFPLPPGRFIRALRFDPLLSAGEIRIRGIRLVDHARRTRLRLTPSTLRAENEIASVEEEDGQTVIRTQPRAIDPILLFAPAEMTAINRVIGKSEGPGAAAPPATASAEGSTDRPKGDDPP